MRIHTEQTGMTKSAPAAGFRTGRFTQGLRADNSGWLESCGSLFQKQPLDEEQTDHISGGTGHEKTGDRSDVHKIYEAALQGSKTPITSLKTAPKVPYGYLAKDGVITYNGVAFICDEKTNSICLGDVSDPKKTINIPLSGGGHLKVNRGGDRPAIQGHRHVFPRGCESDPAGYSPGYQAAIRPEGNGGSGRERGGRDYLRQ